MRKVVTLALAIAVPAAASAQTQPNTIGRASSFSAGTENFMLSSGDVIDGCITAGSHRVMRYATINENWGNAHLSVGVVPPAGQSTADFVWDPGHGHHHARGFFGLELFDENGAKARDGLKFGFCLTSNFGPLYSPQPAGPSPSFGCNSGDTMGIRAGFGDIYPSGTACNIMNLDGFADGTYLLSTTSNASRSRSEADPYDNTTAHRVTISGNTVTQIDPTFRSSQQVVPAITGTTQIAVVARGTDRYDAFWKGTDGKLYTNWRNTTGTWQSPSGTVISDAAIPYSLKEGPAAIASAFAAIDVFGRNSDNAIYRFVWRGGGWTYSSFGGTAGGPPAAATASASRQVVGVIWSDGTFRYRRFDGSAWSGWTSLGGSFQKIRPVIVTSGKDTFHIIVKNSSNNVLHRMITNGTASSAWTNLGGVHQGAVSADSWNVNRLDVLTRGTDNKLYRKSWKTSPTPVGTPAWTTSWEALTTTGELVSSPAVIAPRPDRLEVFYYVNQGGTIFYKRKAWNGTAWVEELPSAFSGITASTPPVLSTWADGVVSVFHAISDGSVRQRERR
jgi:hypothetical protein